MTGLRARDDLRRLLDQVHALRARLEAVALPQAFESDRSLRLDALLVLEEDLAAWITYRETSEAE